MKIPVCTSLILLILSLPAIAAETDPEEIPTAPYPAEKADMEHYSDTLFGDWRGRRSAMFAKGYDLQVVYKLDLLNNTAVERERIYGLDNLDIKLKLDFEKITGGKDTTAFLHVISNRGDKPGAHSDRLPHGVDNIETPANGNTTKIFQAWLQETFLDGRVSVLGGLYDLNAEFYTTESAAMFMHPTFGMSAELAGTGKNGPSVFPTSSIALRVKTEPAPGYYVQAITLDGVPGDPNNPQGTHIKFDEGDGALNVIEGGIPLGLPKNAHNNKLAFGVWQYTTRFDDILDVDASGKPVQRVSSGAYAMLEKVLKYKAGSHEEQISGFFRIGRTEGDTSQFDLALSAGLVFAAVFPGREQDELGIAYAQERNSDKYRIASGNTVYSEKSFELGYRYRALPGFTVQPFVQYLQNHSKDITQDKTWWLGMRTEAAF
ncbi:MAG TPA: carbohydrate porin [Gallionellaceae bacterium]|nr:carbohydrate porin [Gallionellaceae bacterium]